MLYSLAYQTRNQDVCVVIVLLCYDNQCNNGMVWYARLGVIRMSCPLSVGVNNSQIIITT